MEWFSHCGTCRFCRTGRYNLCDDLQRTSGKSHAGFAEYVIAHQSSLFKVPDALSFEEGALVEPLSVSYRAVRRCEEEARGTLLVTGSGTIGLLAVAAAKSLGTAAVICTARHDHQATMAAQLGADHVLHEGSGPAAGASEELMTLTAGAGADAVIETTASAAGLQDAFTSVRRGGCVVLVGGFREPFALDLKRVVDNEIRILGSLCYSTSGMKRDFDWAMELIASKKVPAHRLVTHRFPLGEIARAFEVAADKDTGSIKVQICRT
jgi:L-iditol 2-dehydrogenase